MTLAAWRGQEALASELIARERRAARERGLGRLDDFASYASSVLYNGIGRYDAAHRAVGRAFEQDRLGYTPFVVPEVAEAASRTGDTALLRAALEWMSERTAVTPTDWALGIDARVRALASDGEATERLYRESIERLAHTRVRVEVARARLLYGEWLRREGRRVDAREQLRVAREALLAMGAEGFAAHIRHGEEGQPVRLSGGEKRNYVRMLELRRELDFATEPVDAHAGGHFRRQHLHNDLAAER